MSADDPRGVCGPRPSTPAEHAAEYVRRMELVSQSLGALTRITVDDARLVVRVEWECGRIETLSVERFVELVKSAAARFGDAVPF